MFLLNLNYLTTITFAYSCMWREYKRTDG